MMKMPTIVLFVFKLSAAVKLDIIVYILYLL